VFPAKVLVATNGTAEAAPALEAAVDLSSGTGSELHIVHVVSTVPVMPYPGVTAQKKSEAFLEQRRLGGLRLLEYQSGRVRDLGWDVAATHYREGVPEKEVLKLGRDLDAGIIVTGGQKRPWFERIFGAGFSTKVLRRADRPVLVVGQRGSQSVSARSG
jgi:nucleotide-binding universal stress UspA family protein